MYENWKAKTEKCAVKKDGKKLFEGTQNECFVWILNHQSSSVDWALKYEGYKVVDLDP